jgi:hypothetical protein
MEIGSKYPANSKMSSIGTSENNGQARSCSTRASAIPGVDRRPWARKGSGVIAPELCGSAGLDDIVVAQIPFLSADGQAPSSVSLMRALDLGEGNSRRRA